MKRKHIALLVVLALLIGASSYYAFFRIAILETSVPTTDIPPSLSLPATVSSLNVPVIIPVDTLDDLADQVTPSSFSSQPAFQKDDLDITVNWHLNRTDIALSVEDNKLHATTRLTGRATIRVHAGPASVSENIDLRGSASIAFEPRVQNDWRMIAHDLDLSYDLDKALVKLPMARIVTEPIETVVEAIRWVPIIGAVAEETTKIVLRPVKKITEIQISVRTKVREYLDPEIQKLQKDLAKKFANLNVLRPMAIATWNDLCRARPITDRLFLQTTPVRFRSAQPVLRKDHILTQLGVDIEMRISPHSSEPVCPFADALVLEPIRPGSIAVALPAEIDYGTVQTALNALLTGKSFGDAITVRVDSVALQPARAALLLTLNVTVATKGWFNKRAAGALYVWAVPRLATDRRSIILDNVRLDTESEDALVALFGEIGEPLFLRKLRTYSFDLDPTYRNIKSQANTALNTLSSDKYAVDGQITKVLVYALQLGPTGVHVVGVASGEVAVELR